MNDDTFLKVYLSSEQLARVKNLLHYPQIFGKIDESLRALNLAYIHAGQTYATKFARMLFDPSFSRVVSLVAASGQINKGIRSEPSDYMAASKFKKKRLFAAVNLVREQLK
ncbi:hypothetical protein [Solidesulfovibrio magneticus]|uniref:Uncharacterized protein n=1 Tax=Solidesulfovibrio magneticus (strain ATCC 700980 / DSM 13731 / RS-1) TaxID=573370 RepID=C4XJE3_SOLM1|nr:hypothetical protein [Solidesulfovibrio magneticus]BAH76693.1 hypothetical protein DMR_32020 [Solidesulfovibrio magneticus RS-1]